MEGCVLSVHVHICKPPQAQEAVARPIALAARRHAGQLEPEPREVWAGASDLVQLQHPGLVAEANKIEVLKRWQFEARLSKQHSPFGCG